MEKEKEKEKKPRLDLISEISLEYLMNKEQYAKYCEKKEW